MKRRSMMKKKSAMKKRSMKKSMKKRGKNQFFKLMLAAKKANKKSFSYKGKTYTKRTKGHLTFYKA